MTSRDIAEGMALKDLAGWNQPLSTGNDFSLPALTGCFAAKDRGRVIGTSATIVYESRFAWIGMVIVDRSIEGLAWEPLFFNERSTMSIRASLRA